MANCSPELRRRSDAVYSTRAVVESQISHCLSSHRSEGSRIVIGDETIYQKFASRTAHWRFISHRALALHLAPRTGASGRSDMTARSILRRSMAFACLASALSAVVTAQPRQPAAARQIRAVLDRQVEAWN